MLARLPEMEAGFNGAGLFNRLLIMWFLLLLLASLLFMVYCCLSADSAPGAERQYRMYKAAWKAAQEIKKLKQL